MKHTLKTVKGDWLIPSSTATTTTAVSACPPRSYTCVPPNTPRAEGNEAGCRCLGQQEAKRGGERQDRPRPRARNEAVRRVLAPSTREGAKKSVLSDALL